MKNIKIQNYLLLIVILIGSTLLAFKIIDNYKLQEEEKNSQTELDDVLAEIKWADIESYINDNVDAIIYLSDLSNENKDNFEKNFKKLITAHDLGTMIVFLDMSEINDDDYAVLESYFKADEYNNLDNPEYRSLIIFSEGIIDYVLTTEVSDTSIESFENILVNEEVIDNES